MLVMSCFLTHSVAAGLARVAPGGQRAGLYDANSGKPHPHTPINICTRNFWDGALSAGPGELPERVMLLPHALTVCARPIRPIASAEFLLLIRTRFKVFYSRTSVFEPIGGSRCQLL